MRIRVSTRADLFEKRKQQHVERGYRIEEERPIAVNGLCSFIAVKELPVSESLAELAKQPNFLRVRLRGLSASETAQFVAATSGEGADAAAGG